MQSAGVSFQSHSLVHLDLTRLSYDECVRDLRSSRELLESVLGAPVQLLAYPRGRHNPDVRAAAEAAGYTHAFTLPERREPSGPYAIPRVGVYHRNTVGRLRLKCAPGYLAARTSYAAHLLRRAPAVGAGR
jgi:peptidoglycan/xylan/chitin deacetylase (PgdA/CDA1 family)